MTWTACRCGLRTAGAEGAVAAAAGVRRSVAGGAGEAEAAFFDPVGAMGLRRALVGFRCVEEDEPKAKAGIV